MSLVANIDLEVAGKRSWDAVIVGAGPAGGLTSRELARHGAQVLLVDKARFPRWKVCGCCLSGAALDALQKVGLGELPRQLGGVPLRAFQLSTAGRSAQVPLPTGLSLSREALDSGLVQAGLEHGVCFLPETRAILEGVKARETHLRLEQGARSTQVCSRIVVAAGGLAGRLRAGDEEFAPRIDAGSRLGAGTFVERAPGFYEPGVIYMACARGGYLGLVRLEDGRLDVAAALDRSWVSEAGGLGQAALGILEQAKWPTIPGFADLEWRGTPALTRRPRQLGGERYFLVGDSAGYVEPFTGEGIAWALLSAAALTPIALQAIQAWRPGLVSEWTARHHRLLGRRQRVCKLVARGLRTPALTGLAVSVLARLPVLARPLIHHLNRGSIPSWGALA